MNACSLYHEMGIKNEAASTPTSETVESLSAKNKEVGNGLLLKVGEWKNDTNFGKLTLYKITTLHQIITHGPLEITTPDMKIFEVEANQTQLNYASGIFNSNDITSTYYYIQIAMSVKSTSDQPALPQGVSTVVTSIGQQMDSTMDLYDSFIGQAIAAGATKDTNVVGLIKANDQEKVSSVKITFAEVYSDNSNYSSLVGNSNPADINF